MEDKKALRVVLLFDTDRKIFAIDPRTTASLVYKSWLSANQLLQSLVSINRDRACHMHISVVLSSGAAYQLLLHDACISAEHSSRTNIIAALASYSSWVRLISLTTSQATSVAVPDDLCMQEQMQTYLYVLSLMKLKRIPEKTEAVLVYVTGQTQTLRGLHDYENLATQLAAVGSRCLILNLSGKLKRDFRAAQLFSRIGGSSMDFMDVIKELPDQTNPVHYERNGENTAGFRPFLNSTVIKGKGKELVALRDDFREKLDQFLFPPAEMSALKKSPASPSWKPGGMPMVEVCSYEIKGTIKALQKARALETFKIRTSNADLLKASLLWKPNIKIVYMATVSEGRVIVTIKLRTLRSVFSVMLSEEATSSRAGNSLLCQMRKFIASIRTTDGVVNKIALLSADFTRTRLLQEIAALPVCSHHKWFTIKSIDVVYAGKVSPKKSRACYLTDYILLKKSLSGVFKDMNLAKIEATNLTYVFQLGVGFVLIRPIFFMSNVATVYASFYESPDEQIDAFTGKFLEQVALVRKLRLFHRPLHFAVIYQAISSLTESYRDRENGRSSISKTFLRDIEEVKEGEGLELSLEEAERELEAQLAAEQVGASVYTFVPYQDTVINYMQKKRWSWSCAHYCVLRGFVGLLAKQRRYEGFVLLNAQKDVITLVNEEKVSDCSMEEDGRVLLQYLIRFSPREKSVETEIYMEKKDCISSAGKPDSASLFDQLAEEIYRVDTEISKIIWSYHNTKKECLKTCVARRQNSLKHCGFFFDLQEVNVLPELLLIKVYSILTKCYELYANKKYVDNSQATAIKVAEGFTMDTGLLYQNSAALDVQSLFPVKRASLQKADGTEIDEACYQNVTGTLQGVISKIMEEFADAAFTVGMDYAGGGTKKIYAKIVSKKQIVLINVNTGTDSSSMTIEYRQLSKDCFAVFDTMLLDRNDKKRQSSRKDRCKDNIKDEFIRQLLEDAELDFDVYAEPEIHEVHFEISLLKVVKNFEAYISEEYNSQLLAFCYNVIMDGYKLSQEVLEAVLANAHRFTFSFNLSSLFKMYAAINTNDADPDTWSLHNVDMLDSQFKSFLSTFFRELPGTGYYYYCPKPVSSYTGSDNSLLAELETLFGANTGLSGEKLPLFAKLTVTFKTGGRIIDSLPVKSFRDVCNPSVIKKLKAGDAGELWEEIKKMDVSLNLALHIVGKHKVFEDERYYERKDIDDAITMEDYYDQISEGVEMFELGLASVLGEDAALNSKVSVNMDAYMEAGTGEFLLYPFQSRLYLQLIPENYIRGNFIFTVPDEYIRAFYAILRPVKSFLAELALMYVTNLCISNTNKDMMTYIRLKMGELYSDQLEKQVHHVFFVNYSQQALEIFNAELDSQRYNLRRIDNFYYVVWPCTKQKPRLQLEADTKSECESAYAVKYWILFRFSVNRDLVTMQLNAHFSLGEGAQDTSATVQKTFADAFQKISTKVNQQILLNQLNERKKCPKLLFPSEKMQKRDLAVSDKKKERRQTDRMSKLLLSTRKSIRNILPKEEKENNVSEATRHTGATYMPGLLFSKEFSVTERLSIKSLGDVRGGFLKSFAVLNRECMYVMSKDKAIYVIRFTELSREAAKQNESPRIVMNLYGIEPAPTEFIDNLLMTVESQLTMIALTKIAKNITQNINMCSGPLSIYDYRFLSQSENQINMLFPLSPHITDSYALLKYLAQNLKKFMITCRFETGTKKCLRLEAGKYVLNSSPIIKRSSLFGPMEQFIVGKDDPDFTMVFNPLYNVNNTMLGQIFGDGLSLLKLSMLSVPPEAMQPENMEKWIKDNKLQETYTEREMNRFVPLSRYRKNTPWTEYVSIIGNDTMLGAKDLDSIVGLNKDPESKDQFCLFTYPIIVRHLNRRDEEKAQDVEISRALCDKLADARKYTAKEKECLPQKYLKLELNIKGPLNAEELQNALILYANQALAEFMVEKSYEIFELGMRSTLLSVKHKTQKEKNQALLDVVHHFETWMRKVYDFAKDVKSPLFFSTEIPVLAEYRYHISLICKMIGEICKKILLPNISALQLEGLCLYLVVYVVSNSDESLQKIYIIKNVQNYAQLYTFLRRTLTFQNVEMRNRTVQYELIVLSKSIPEVRPLFTPSKGLPGVDEVPAEEDTTISFVDCFQAESLSQARRVRSFNANSAASENLPATSSDETEETMGNVKAQHVIQVNSGAVCHVIPRTVFLRLTLRKSGVNVNVYNFARRSVEIIEKTLSLAVLWYNKKSAVLTDLLMRKMGIAVGKGLVLPEGLSLGRNPSWKRPEKSFISRTMADFVEKTLQNKHLGELNQYVPQERAVSVALRATILGEQPQMFESELKPRAPSQDYAIRVKLGDLTSDNMPEDKERQPGTVSKIEFSDFEIEAGNYSSDAAKLSWLNTPFYSGIVRSQRALKYLYVNPLFYHTVRPQLSFELFRKEHEGLVDKLQFYVEYRHHSMADMSSEKQEREQKLFKYMNMASQPMKGKSELIAAILGMSTLCYTSTAPFMFSYRSDLHGNTDTGEIMDDSAKAKKSYIKIFSDYFNGLCEMIKTQFGFSKPYTTEVNPNFMNVEYINIDRNERTYIGKSPTQFFPQRLIEEPPPFKFRKATSSSSLSSKKDSLLEKDERYFLVSNPALCKGAGHKLPPVRCLKLKECKAYFCYVAYNAAYIVELECMHYVSEVKVWTLKDLVNAEHISSFDKIFLNEAERLPECQSSLLHVDYQLSNIVGGMRLDAFNYDIHVQSLLLVLNGCREQKGFLEVVTNFLKYYPDPPKRAKNSVKAGLISIYMGDIDSDPDSFWKYFLANAQLYGYKSRPVNQLAFCGVLESETFVDSTGSLKYSGGNTNNKDLEDKKEGIAVSDSNLYKSSEYAQFDVQVVPGPLDSKMLSNPKIIASHRKSHTSTTLPQPVLVTSPASRDGSPQLVRGDSITDNNKGLADENNVSHAKIVVESGSTHKDSQVYQSYAVFMYCKNPLDCEAAFKKERTLKIKEIDEAAEYNEETNKLEIQVCGMQALGIRLEDYAKYPDAAPPKIQYPEIEDALYEKLRECKRHFINDRLWEKLMLNYERKNAYWNHFTYDDLRKLHCYSDKDDIMSLNEKYSGLLFIHQPIYNVFFDRLRARYQKRLRAFSKEMPKSAIEMKRDDKSMRSSRMSILRKVPKYIPVTNNDAVVDNISDYLVVPENYRSPMAVHIRRENDRVAIYVLRKYGTPVQTRELESALVNEICNLYVYCTYLTLTGQNS